jgi:integrase
MPFQAKAAKKRLPRAKGEGSIFQRKDGMWVGSVETGYDENGKRRQKRVYAKEYLSVVAKLDELKADTADGLSLDRNMTVAKWLDYWLDHVHKERIRPTTYLDYTWSVRNIARVIGHKKLVELQPSDVRRMHTVIGKGERRTQKAHVVLHRALKDAVAEGLLRRNIVDAVHTPEVYKGERRAFTVEQVQKLLAYSAQHSNRMEHARWMLAFLTGVRQGESLGLTWDRVNLNENDGAIDISWQLQQIKRVHGCGDQVGGTWPCGRKHGSRCTAPVLDVPVKFEHQPLVDSLVLSRPKSESGKRWVPVIEPLRSALADLADLDRGPNPYNLVFHRADGYPITPTADNAAWNDLLAAAEVEGEGLTLHSARHTTATVLRAAGADEQTRMEILGHNSPEVTRIYAHADQAKNSTMMDALAVLVPKQLPATETRQG